MPAPADPSGAQPHSPYPQPQEYGGSYPPPMPMPMPYQPGPPQAGAYYQAGLQYGYPGAAATHAAGVRRSAVAALVVNVVLTMLCASPFGIAGTVLSAIALSRADHRPDSARTPLRWAWGMVIATAVLLVAAVVAVIVFLLPAAGRS